MEFPLRVAEGSHCRWVWYEGGQLRVATQRRQGREGLRGRYGHC
jgi:hypothetical protein